jgi:hypothetical protein
MTEEALLGLIIAGFWIAFYAIGLIILWASCAVAEIKTPGIFLTLGLVLAVQCAATALAWGGYTLFRLMDANKEILLSPYGVTGVVLSQLVMIGLAGLLYRAVLARSLKKGLWAAAIEKMLQVLAAGLLLADFFFCMSLGQMTGIHPVVWTGLFLDIPLLVGIVCGVVWIIQGSAEKSAASGAAA